MTFGMQSVSDVVFGLALSIGSVILIAKLPQDPDSLAQDVLAFGFNFLIVVLVWLGYRRAGVALPHENQATVIVNVALLFTVAIEPFLFWVMWSAREDLSFMLEPTSMAYALDVGSMMLLQSTLNRLLLAEERAAPRKGFPPAVIERIRGRMWAGLLVGLLFLASSLPIFWVPVAGSTIRIELWFVGLALTFVIPRVVARVRRRQEVPKDV